MSKYVYLEVNKNYVLGEFKFNDKYKIPELIGKRCWEITNGLNLRVFFLDDNRVLYKNNKEKLNNDNVLTFVFKWEKEYNVWSVEEEKYIKYDIAELLFYFCNAISEVVSGEDKIFDET